MEEIKKILLNKVNEVNELYKDRHKKYKNKYSYEYYINMMLFLLKMLIIKVFYSGDTFKWHDFIVNKYFTALLIQSIPVITAKIWVHPSRISNC